MTDRFEEDLGKFPYVTLAQVKDYLSISSNTQDARISNIVHYATSVIEHYIGQEILANDYVEVFDGGAASVFVSRLPLNNVYQVTEFNGYEHSILADPSTVGTPNSLADNSLTINFYNNAHITDRTKRFGLSCLELGTPDYIGTSIVPDQLQFDESNFTVEMYVRVDESTLQDNVVFSLNTDSANYIQLKLANLYGLAFTSNITGSATTIQGANTSVESQEHKKRRWAHIAVTRDLDNERLYLHYNGNTIANSAYAEANLSFTANLIIGSTFKGYIDEFRISNKARYTSNFTPSNFRFRPDLDTVCLIHFDEKNNAKVCKDVHTEPNEYNFSRDTGEITRDVRRTHRSVQRSYPGISLVGATTFLPFPNGVRVEYRAGYESNSVPYDLQLATLDFIKILYKQDQEKKGFSFEGESGSSFNLSSNFPPHVSRILEMYRIIK